MSDKLLRGSDDFVWSVEFTMYAKFLLEVEFHDLKVASVNVSVLHLPFLVLGYLKESVHGPFTVHFMNSKNYIVFLFIQLHIDAITSN